MAKACPTSGRSRSSAWRSNFSFPGRAWERGEGAAAAIVHNSNQGILIMKAFTTLMGAALCAAMALIPGDAAGQRGGGRGGGGGGRGGGGGARPAGGGGARPAGGGGARPAGGGVPMNRPASAGATQARPNPTQSGAVHGPYGGSGNVGRQTAPVSGAGGGSGTVGRQGGSYTTGGGTNVTGGSKGGALYRPAWDHCRRWR